MSSSSASSSSNKKRKAEVQVSSPEPKNVVQSDEHEDETLEKNDSAIITVILDLASLVWLFMRCLCS